MNIFQTQDPKARIAVLGVILLLPFLGLAAWYWASRPSNTNDQLTRIVEEYGYSAVTPPSRLFGPGTITTVETLSNGTLQMHLACKMDNNSLAAMWNKSPTINRSLVAAVKQTFESSAKALDVISSGTTGKSVQDIDVSLRNINIVTMSYENLIDVRSQYLKGTCEEVVIGNLRAGAAVCQPEEVLEADLVYKKDIQDGLGGGGKVEVAEQGAGSVNVDREASEANEVQGDDLFLGAKVSRSHCFRLEKNGQVAASNF